MDLVTMAWLIWCFALDIPLFQVMSMVKVSRPTASKFYQSLREIVGAVGKAFRMSGDTDAYQVGYS